MSEMRLFALLDNKAGVYGQPFMAINPAMAMREIRHASKRNKEEIWTTFSEDFVLVSLGHYDQRSGQIIASLEHIVDLKYLLAMENDQVENYA